MAQAAARPHPDFDRAIAAYRAGRLAEAERHCRQVVQDQPGLARAHDLLGLVQAERGAREQGLKQIRKAARNAPKDPLIRNDLAQVLLALGRPQEARSELLRAVRFQPDYASGWQNLGNAERALGKLAAALDAYRKAAAANPRLLEAFNNAGNVLLIQERYGEALEAYNRALALDPSNPNLRVNKAACLVGMQETQAGRELAEAVAAEHPDMAQAHNFAGNAALEQGDLDGAAAAYRRAIAAAPGYAEAHANLGRALNAAGEAASAESAVREALRLAPDYPSALAVLPELRRIEPGEADHHALERLAARSDSLLPHQRAQLHYALGAIYERAGDADGAFAQYRQGAAARRETATGTFDSEERPRFDALRRHVTAERVAALRQSGGGRSDPRPVFIVGMPRSGTSLVEQILASHGEVHGAGELRTWHQVVAERFGDRAAAPGFDRFGELTAGDLTAIADRYLAHLDGLAAGGAARITDKMPQNFLLVPLIRLALPEARIVHVRRDPMATGWSCFKQLFAHRLYWTFDLEEIGAYYRHYADLMAHWRALFPGEFVKVDYESLVADPETEARRLVDYLGLAWDPACLRFYESERPVMTASLHQVRQPIYSGSLQGWQRFAHHLEPLRQALGDLAPPAPET